MRENRIRILCSVLHVDLVCQSPDGSLTPFFDAVADSPLLHSAELRELLRVGANSQSAPFLYQGESSCYFAAIRSEDDLLFMGPMPHGQLTAVRRRRMYRAYGVEGSDLRGLPGFTLPEIRNMILLANTILENGNLRNEELMQLNRIISESEQSSKREQTAFVIKEEEENDDALYRHTYHEEQLLMQAIREGRTEDAVRLAEGMDADSGRLSREDSRHRRNLAIVGIALCSRAAIDGGVSPESAYRLSGYYIRKCDAAQDPAHLLHYRNRAIEEMTARVTEAQDRHRSSSCVERCKDYVRKHYREKIYLDEVAGVLGISPSYLSRLFKKETGIRLQDYINEERVYRASNLLMYSDLSLTEIANYVHFPNQSYFGKIFKKQKGMTPKAFRDRYKTAEFESGPGAK